jgi:hypothetical protein
MTTGPHVDVFWIPEHPIDGPRPLSGFQALGLDHALGEVLPESERQVRTIRDRPLQVRHHVEPLKAPTGGQVGRGFDPLRTLLTAPVKENQASVLLVRRMEVPEEIEHPRRRQKFRHVQRRHLGQVDLRQEPQRLVRLLQLRGVDLQRRREARPFDSRRQVGQAPDATAA